MKARTLEQFAGLVAKKSGPWAKIAVFRGGMPQLAEIEAGIKALGFVTEYTDVKGGAWAKVYKPYSAAERKQCKPEATDADCRYLVAQGASPEGRDDALLQAVFGAVREEEAAKAVDVALKMKGHKVDAALRQKLESRYILEGGAARLALDLKAFSA